jgi:hypothetical protein
MGAAYPIQCPSCGRCFSVRDAGEMEIENGKLRAEVERLQRENLELGKDKETLSCALESERTEVNRLTAIDAGTKMILENQHREIERLRGLCGISAAVIRKMENTANQIIGSHKHVHDLRDACGWEHTKCGIAWLEAAERKEGQ